MVASIGRPDKTCSKNILICLGEGIEDRTGNLNRFPNLLKRPMKKPASLRRCQRDVGGEENDDDQKGESARFPRQRLADAIQTRSRQHDHSGQEKKKIPFKEIISARPRNSVGQRGRDQERKSDETVNGSADDQSAGAKREKDKCRANQGLECDRIADRLWIKLHIMGYLASCAAPRDAREEKGEKG